MTTEDQGPGAPPGEPGGAVDVYWRPGCVWCARLRRSLRRAGLATREHQIWSDPSAATFVRVAAGGNETVPTVAVGDTVLVNPSPARVVELACATGAELDPPTPWWRRVLGHRATR